MEKQISKSSRVFMVDEHGQKTLGFCCFVTILANNKFSRSGAVNA